MQTSNEEWDEREEICWCSCSNCRALHLGDKTVSFSKSAMSRACPSFEKSFLLNSGLVPPLNLSEIGYFSLDRKANIQSSGLSSSD